MSRFISACEDFMIKEIFEENSDEFYEFSQIYNLNKMKTVSLQKTASKYRNSLENIRLEYDFEEFVIILNVWKIWSYPQRREKYYHCILAWMKKDEVNRKPFLPNLLELLPLNELSSKFSKSIVLPEVMMQESHTSCIQVMNALTHPIDGIPPLPKLDPNEVIINSKPRRSFKTSSRYCDSDEE